MQTEGRGIPADSGRLILLRRESVCVPSAEQRPVKASHKSLSRYGAFVVCIHADPQNKQPTPMSWNVLCCRVNII